MSEKQVDVWLPLDELDAIAIRHEVREIGTAEIGRPANASSLTQIP